MLKPLLLGAAIVCCGASATAAATCGEAVELFAREYGLAATPQGDRSALPPTAPATTESRGMTTTDKLAETDGVVKPPDVGSDIAVEPPKTGDPMTTAPKVEPGPTPTVPPRKVELDAARRAQIDSLLTAARAADKAGKSEQCYERLQEAQNLVPRTSG